MSPRVVRAAADVAASLARLRLALLDAAPSPQHRDAVAASLDAARDRVLDGLGAAGFGAARRGPP